jgi:hypothetical protein
MSYDHWKTTNPEDEWLGPEPKEQEEVPPNIMTTRMNRQIITSMKRIALYHDRLQDAVVANNPVQATVEAAELAEIAKLLCAQFKEVSALHVDRTL